MQFARPPAPQSVRDEAGSPDPGPYAPASEVLAAYRQAAERGSDGRGPAEPGDEPARLADRARRDWRDRLVAAARAHPADSSALRTLQTAAELSDALHEPDRAEELWRAVLADPRTAAPDRPAVLRRLAHAVGQRDVAQGMALYQELEDELRRRTDPTEAYRAQQLAEIAYLKANMVGALVMAGQPVPELPGPDAGKGEVELYEDALARSAEYAKYTGEDPDADQRLLMYAMVLVRNGRRAEAGDVYATLLARQELVSELVRGEMAEAEVPCTEPTPEAQPPLEHPEHDRPADSISALLPHQAAQGRLSDPGVEPATTDRLEPPGPSKGLVLARQRPTMHVEFGPEFSSFVVCAFEPGVNDGRIARESPGPRWAAVARRSPAGLRAALGRAPQSHGRGPDAQH